MHEFVTADSTDESGFVGSAKIEADRKRFGLPDRWRVRDVRFERAALTNSRYFAMQTFFGSVKKRSASSPPSRPTPLCFMPPNGTRRSRTSQQFTQTVPV